MQSISLTGFAGAARAPNVRLLSEQVGYDIIDAQPGLGELRPLRTRSTVATVPTGSQQKTIYRFGRDTPSDANYWFSWPTTVSVARSVDGQDTTERTLFTGSGTPKWTDNTIGLSGGPPYPQGTRELAVPAPVVPVTLAQSTPGTGTDETRFYLHTFVNELGWESAASPVSAGITVKPGAIIDITGLPAAPAGSYGINRRRIYRTQPGTTDAPAEFFFLREVSIGTTSTGDDARILGDPIATADWISPPADAHSIIALWNGMFAMLADKRVLFAEANAPYAVPAKYDQAVQDLPVATAKWEQNLLVLTTGRSVLFQGQVPDGMSEVPSFAGASCAAPRSVVSFGHGVVWASAEGLAYSGVAELLTLGVLTQDQWKALQPETMVAGRYGRLYVASYGVGGSRKGFMFDPLRPQDGIWFLSSGFDACWYDELTDQLYVLEGGNVRKFDAGPALLTATFKSKVYRQTYPRNFGFAKVVGDVYPVTFTLHADFVDPVSNTRSMQVKHTRSVSNDEPFALPAGWLAEDFQVEVTAAGAVQAVHLATTPQDLRTLG